MSVCCVYFYVYINTHTYSIYFENVYMYVFTFIIDIIYKYIKYINLNFFLNIYMHVCVFI